jgi:hypothetical protein
MEDKDRQLLTVPEAAVKLKIGWSRRVPAEAIGEFIDRLASEQASASA